MNSTQPPSGSGSRKLVLIILVIAIAFVAFLLAIITFVSNLASSSFRPNQTQAVPGDPAFFDPIAALPDVHTFAGENSQLVSIDSDYVRSDGTMDLTATSYRPETRYIFVIPAAGPAEQPPPGAGGGGQWYQEIDINAYRVGQFISVDSTSYHYTYTNLGMDRREGSPNNSSYRIVPDPTCTFRQLWSVALERGAQADAVAQINYDDGGYSFDISGTEGDVHLRFGMDCALLGDTGSVPIAPPTAVEPVEPGS